MKKVIYAVTNQIAELTHIGRMIGIKSNEEKINQMLYNDIIGKDITVYYVSMDKAMVQDYFNEIETHNVVYSNGIMTAEFWYFEEIVIEVDEEENLSDEQIIKFYLEDCTRAPFDILDIHYIDSKNDRYIVEEEDDD